MGLLGLLCIPLGSSLHDFSVRQYLEAEFGKIKAGQIKRLKVAEKNPRLWSRVRLLYSNVRVNDIVASVDYFSMHRKIFLISQQSHPCSKTF